MIHGRPNEARFHVRGFIDQGSTTTPFDMVVRNKISRYHLVMDALKYVPRIRSKAVGRRRPDESQALRASRLYPRALRGHAGDRPVALDQRLQRIDASRCRLAKGQPRAQLFTDG